MSVEKGGSADERVQMNSSRMVVVSNATFVQDNALTQDQQALDFISASANWLLSREQLIGIAPKVPKTLTFSLNEDALRSLRWMVLVVIPLVFVALGTAAFSPTSILSKGTGPAPKKQHANHKMFSILAGRKLTASLSKTATIRSTSAAVPINGGWKLRSKTRRTLR